MNAITSAVQDHIATNHVQMSTKVAGGLSGTMATQTLLLTIWNLGEIAAGSNRAELSKDFTANLSGTCFYGLCAANIIPGTAKLGAAITVLYSLGAYWYRHYVISDDARANRHDYPTTHIIGGAVDGAFRASRRVWNLVYDVAHAIITAVGNFVGRYIPRHPTWYAFTALLLATGAYLLYKRANPNAPLPSINLPQTPQVSVKF